MPPVTALAGVGASCEHVAIDPLNVLVVPMSITSPGEPSP
jgi:hypothetical protein